VVGALILLRPITVKSPRLPRMRFDEKDAAICRGPEDAWIIP
jgi:hypothetical protein